MFDIYAAVTDRIIAELEKGQIPWQKPWVSTVAVKASSRTALTPDQIRRTAYSRSTGCPYSVLNQIMLGKPGEYMTFKQCQEAGGKIKKGEKAHMVVFWKFIPVEQENPLTGEKETKELPFLRYYNVFHIDQTEGVKPRKLTEPKLPEGIKASFDPDEEAERIAADYLNRSGVQLLHVVGDRAFYSPASDMVQLPKVEQFPSKAEYYSTKFHELAHSTGHRSRLDRLSKVAMFGSEDYSKEELVAEISSAAILNHLGMETGSSFRNSAAYVQSWLKALKNDKKMIVGAAGKAEKAVAMILNI